MLNEDVEFVAEVAQAAGRVALPSFGAAQAQQKPDGSLVTPADRAAEELIRQHLQERWPEDDIVGEELLGARDLTRPRVWCLDPIDGTHNFIAGLPLWVVSIGLCARGRPTLGVVHAPLLDLTFTAVSGGGAFLNNDPLGTSQQEEIFRNDLFGITTEAAEKLELRFPHKSRNLGSAALHACYVAAGIFKGALFTHWGVWDLAAGLAIAAEAGAVACTLDGQQLDTLAHLDAHSRQDPLLLAPPQLCSQIVTNIRTTTG